VQSKGSGSFMWDFYVGYIYVYIYIYIYICDFFVISILHIFSEFALYGRWVGLI